MKISLHLWLTLLPVGMALGWQSTPKYQLAHFSADVTIPLNHRCMGVLPTKSKKIVDRLYAHGLALLGPEKPIVFCAVDWCEIRNGSYEKWRTALALAAGTERERVILSALHQHDAPVVDDGAAKLLQEVGLEGELFDQAFQDQTVSRVAQLLKESLTNAQPVTHYAIGQSKVMKIASNRRVVSPESGRVSFSRGSSSGRNPEFAQAPSGRIDPYLKTISFWNQEKPLLAMHSYATHPMSYYGRGEVSSDFVGLARLKRQRDDKTIKQIYFSGCSGDVTAGKYNDGSQLMRNELTSRLYQGMVSSWKTNRRFELGAVKFKNEKLQLPFHEKRSLQEASLTRTLHDRQAPTEKRILAAMGLASLHRVQKKIPIDLPMIDLGQAKIILFPGETFVGYQLMAQEMAAGAFVFSIGYGECWPGYIPTQSAFADGFEDNWLWAGRGSETLIRKSLSRLLDP
ncbi:MAG: hypothetical protein VX438_08340 [Planctomycetota bacterium]|nr:hypothetical protein [Planctomycetota bacterium]